MRDQAWVLAAGLASLLSVAGAVDAHREQRLATLYSQAHRGTDHVRRFLAWISARLTMGPVARRQRAASRAKTIRALSGLAAELEAGQLPGSALVRAGGPSPPWPRAIAAVHAAGDVAGAIELDAQGTALLRHLAACWRVAERSGAGLAASVTRLAVSARAAEDIRASLEGQLAVPRATARMLAVLPLIGVGFGILLGADPVGWLCGTPAGRGCLAGGVVLTLTGLWWTGRIASAVERQL